MGNGNSMLSRKASPGKDFKSSHQSEIEESAKTVLINETTSNEKDDGGDSKSPEQTLLGLGFKYVKQGDSNHKLVHVESNSGITPDNRTQYIPDGPVFDHVVQACQELAQEELICHQGLKWITLSEDEEQPIIQALMSDDNNYEKTFLFITGKGISRAGVFSAKELVESGLEMGSTVYHVKEAQQRNMNIILLDPNALGHERGMGTVSTSLTAILLKMSCSSTTRIHILAHSAGGGQLVRYLLFGPQREDLMERIASICFTDSNHNIQWTKKNEGLMKLLQSPTKCLYVKNNAIRGMSHFYKGDEPAGEQVSTDVWWRHRFGTIPTIWAGTTRHGFVGWSARVQIWQHFDKHIIVESDER